MNNVLRTSAITGVTLPLILAGTSAQAAARTPVSAKAALAYSGSYSTSVNCATWHGGIAWGTKPLGAHYLDVDGTLKSTCRTGWAKLHLHYDTVGNPKDVVVGTAENGGTVTTPFTTEDYLFAYKHIYVELCSENRGHYRCGNRKGPQ